jgi:thiosulfate reductase cytochrome b subunit
MVIESLKYASMEPRGGDLVRRHRLSTRLWHWINAATLLTLLMSGLMIFNAHPHLYWGQYGANPDGPWLEIGSANGTGTLHVGDIKIATTGVLGLWSDASGRSHALAFPSWATLPGGYDLGLARRWHLTFAWLLVASYLFNAIWSVVSGHLWKDLLPRREELSVQNIWQDVRHHATLNFPKGAAALNYNILQKGAYLAVLGLLLPGMVLSGLTMSPAVDAAWPWLLDLFGGRQSARSVHFITAALLVLFVLVHLLMVLLAGPFNEIRSMISGNFRLPGEKR